ncbi:MAG: UDP-N-acetylmuramate dehydrogenase, partial [Clostridia bacterium]|nr:UDP-N-acetylmuramate dehydrogenase [Clostridia bacterium]
LGAAFRLEKGDQAEIEEKMRDFAKRRRDKQPLEYPSAGSFFKRPTGYFAGALIEQSQLKGVSVGGAQVSEKHAGFLINTGNATASDFLQLMKLVQDTVMEKFGVQMENEVRIVGNDP